jgi:hypothetical protein
MAFVRAKKGPPPAESEKYTVHYFDEQGNVTIRSEGSKAWRNNNPGNMVYLPLGMAQLAKLEAWQFFPMKLREEKLLLICLKAKIIGI